MKIWIYVFVAITTWYNESGGFCQMNVKEFEKREKKITDMEYAIVTNFIRLRKEANMSQEQLAKETKVIIWFIQR